MFRALLVLLLGLYLFVQCWRAFPYLTTVALIIFIYVTTGVE